MRSDHRILLVEDSPEMQLIVQSVLRRKFNVVTVSTSAQAVQELESQNFSLIILDVGLPDGDGFKLCSYIKHQERHRQTSVIFLTGNDQVGDKVMGLSLGADDYIVKPFEPMEFEARVEARIRSLEGTKRAQEFLFVGDFKIAPSQHRIFSVVDEKEAAIKLTTTEFKLLYFLIRHEDQVLSREQILNEVWSNSVSVTDRTVDTHIYTIRQKLNPSLADCIQAIPKVGYCFSQVKKSKTA